MNFIHDSLVPINLMYVFIINTIRLCHVIIYTPIRNYNCVLPYIILCTVVMNAIIHYTVPIHHLYRVYIVYICITCILHSNESFSISYYEYNNVILDFYVSFTQRTNSSIVVTCSLRNRFTYNGIYDVRIHNKC